MVKLIAALLAAAIVAACSGPPPIDESKIKLSEDELGYIAEHPTITWAVEDNRPPYVFIEGGTIKGLTVEYMTLIEKRTGLHFQPVITSTFFESLEALKKGKVDVMPALRPTPDRSEYMGFTPPISYNGGVFLFRVNSMPRSPLTTGIRKGEAAKDYLKTRFPDMKLVETDDDEESISLLQKGLLDGSVMDEATADYLVKKGGVKVRKAVINFDYPYSYGYSKENHLLGSILTKAINAISAQDKSTINTKWFAEEN